MIILMCACAKVSIIIAINYIYEGSILINHLYGRACMEHLFLIVFQTATFKVLYIEDNVRNYTW